MEVEADFTSTIVNRRKLKTPQTLMYVKKPLGGLKKETFEP